MTASESAASYYSPILFLVLGGAIVALAIERTGLHRRLALAIVSRGGGGPAQMLFAFMAATALLSTIVSNTATTLIMMPIGLAVLRAARVEPGRTDGFAGALAMGIAFAATIGGFGTLVGSPTNAIAAGIIEKATGYRIDFLTWAIYGIPLVLICVPLCWAILMKVQRVSPTDFDPAAARAGIGETGPWSVAEKRLVPLVALTVAAWIAIPFRSEGDRLPDRFPHLGDLRNPARPHLRAFVLGDPDEGAAGLADRLRPGRRPRRDRRDRPLVGRREKAGPARRAHRRGVDRDPLRDALSAQGFADRRHHRGDRRPAAVRHPRRPRPGHPPRGGGEPAALGGVQQ